MVETTYSDALKKQCVLLLQHYVTNCWRYVKKNRRREKEKFGLEIGWIKRNVEHQKQLLENLETMTHLNLSLLSG